MAEERFLNRLSPAARIALGYLLAGALWILFSDRLAHLLFPQPGLYERAQTLKGWLFVFVTSLCLYAICRKYIETIEAHLREVRRTNRSLRVLTQCNQALVRAREESELLEEVCRILVESGGYPSAWVGLKEAASETQVTLRAGVGLEAVSDPEAGASAEGLGAGEPVNSCLRSGRPVTARNVGKGAGKDEEGPVTSDVETVTVIALPLLQEGCVIGVLVIHASDPDAFDEEEVRLLSELGDDLAYGVWALRSSMERERALQELKEAELRFRVLVEGATDHAIFMLDPEGRILSWNNGAQRIYGYTQEEVLGQSAAMFLPVGQNGASSSLSDEIESARLNGAYQTEGWRVRRDGSTLWADSVLSVLKDEEGRVRGYAKITRDLTRLRQIEERIRTLNEDLERRVEERTAAITVANQELETFSYSVSHDLRAPLRAISGFAEILARRYQENLNSEAKHYLANIIEASSRMNRLIDDLLALARVGRQAIRHEPVQLSRVVDDLVGEVSPLADDYSVAVHSETAPGPTEIWTDPSLLRQILLNLLSNAITYRRPSAEGGPQVWVKLEQEGGSLQVEVRDNGIGIADEYTEKIFRPFQRLHTQEAYPGTGIGLAIVKKAVDLLSGRLRVKSIEGEGSVFRVDLPHCIERGRT